MTWHNITHYTILQHLQPNSDQECSWEVVRDPAPLHSVSLQHQPGERWALWHSLFCSVLYCTVPFWSCYAYILFYSLLLFSLIDFISYSFFHFLFFCTTNLILQLVNCSRAFHPYLSNHRHLLSNHRHILSNRCHLLSNHRHLCHSPTHLFT